MTGCFRPLKRCVKQWSASTVAELTDIITRLLAGRVDFVVVGGLAAVTHGSPVMTHDIDICCDFSVDNLLRVQDALTGINPVHRMTPNRIPLSLTSEFCQGLKNLYLDTDLGQLDCLSQICGLGNYREVVGLSEAIEVDGYSCNVLGIAALIKSKEAMGRDKDREAVRHLLIIRDRMKPEN